MILPFHQSRNLIDVFRFNFELDKLERQGIIEPVDGPTPWISPLVVIPKPKNPNQIRVCVDMRQPNRAILRKRHITPTVDDLIHDLNGATVFSKIDLNSGYHQLELTPDSRYITTFSTHRGLRRYTRLNFGTSSAVEVFQDAIQQTLSGIEGVRNVSDDIIIFGRHQQAHDRALHTVFARLRAKNLTLNPKKCEFNKSSIEFFGYTFPKNGVSPDPKKVAAMNNAKPPSNAHEVRSFLSMTNYCSRFIPNYSTITAPLRTLTKSEQPWTWTSSEQQGFVQLKRLLISDTILSYFNPHKKATILVDASPVGLGAILCQENRVVAYANRSLSPVEQRYSQTEREALAVLFACEDFHLYIYSAQFSIITDHKLLERIFSNPSARSNVRLERWALKLQPYDFTITYSPGKTNPADYLVTLSLPLALRQPRIKRRNTLPFLHITPPPKPSLPVK